MADNIKQFTNTVEAPRAIAPVDKGSQAFEQEGRHVEASYAVAGRAIGGGLATVGDEYIKHETLVETADLTNKFAQLEMDTAKNFEQAKTNMDPHDTDAASNFVQQHQEALEAIGSDIRTDAGRQMYNRLAASYRVNSFNKVLGYQTEAAANSVIDGFKQAGKTYANLAEQDPTSAKAAAQNLETASAGLPAEHRAAITSELKTQVYDSAGEGIVNRLVKNPNVKPTDVDAARALLNDPNNGYVGNMSPAQFAAINAKLDRIKDTSANVQSVINAQALGDVYKQLETNGGNDPGGNGQKIIDNYVGKTPDETKIWKAEQQRKYDDATAFGKATAGVNSMPQADVEATVNNLQGRIAKAAPDQLGPLQASLKAVQKASAERDKAFFNDPAGWVRDNNEAVQARYNAFAQNPSPETFQQYAMATVAEQKRLYPNQVPRVVSDEMAQTIAGAVNKITNDPQGASAAATTLSSYAHTAGPYWSQMSQELYKQKVLNSDQFVAASLYGKPNGTALAEQILRASVVPQKDLLAMHAGDENMTQSKVRAAANAAFAPLAKTLTDDRSGVSLVGGYEEALTTLMLYRGSTKDASLLASKMINDEYAFKGTYRIPNAARVNADDVDAGLKSALGRVSDANSGIASANLIVPPSYSGLGPNDQKRAYVANVQAQGHWVTNSTEDGVVLYDEQNHPVWQKGKDGKPQMVGMKWADAEAKGVVARGVTGKVYKFITGQ